MSIQIRQRRIVAATPACARERNADNPSDPACVAALGGQRNYSRLQEEKKLNPYGQGFWGDVFEFGRVANFWFLPRKQGVQAQAAGDYVARTGASYYTGGASEALLTIASGKSGGDILSTAYSEPKLRYAEAGIIGAGAAGGISGAAGGTYGKLLSGAASIWNVFKSAILPSPTSTSSASMANTANRSRVAGPSPINGGSDPFSAPYQSVASGSGREGAGGSFFTTTGARTIGASVKPGLVAGGIGIIAALALLRLSR